MLVTLGLCVFADISIAVEVGRHPRAAELLPAHDRPPSRSARSQGSELASRLTDEQAERVPEGVLVFTVDGPFFFGAVEEFESALCTPTPTRTRSSSSSRTSRSSTSPGSSRSRTPSRRSRSAAWSSRCAAPHAEVAARLERAEIAGTASVPATATLAEALEAVTRTLAAMRRAASPSRRAPPASPTSRSRRAPRRAPRRAGPSR